MRKALSIAEPPSNWSQTRIRAPKTSVEVLVGSELEVTTILCKPITGFFLCVPAAIKGKPGVRLHIDVENDEAYHWMQGGKKYT